MLARLQSRMVAWGIMEPAVRVVIASDGATLTIGRDEIRVFEPVRTAGEPPAESSYVVAADRDGARVMLTRAGAAPIALTTYAGQAGVQAARRVLRELAISRIRAEERRGWPWFRMAFILLLAWIGVRVLWGVPTSPASAVASPAAYGAMGPRSPLVPTSSAVNLPGAPLDSVNCGNLE